MSATTSNIDWSNIMAKRSRKDINEDFERAMAANAVRHVRYVPMPITGFRNVIKYQAFDTKTDNFIGWQYTDIIQAQEKCNELNRLKAPH